MLQKPATTLVYLALGCTGNITDLFPITRCTKLSHLKVKNLKTLTNAHFCAFLTAMEGRIRHLTLEDLEWLSDAGLEAIGKLPVVKQLVTLQINSMPVTMAGLRGVAKDLEKLEQFGGNQLFQVTEDDWSEFFTLVPHLKRLSLQVILITFLTQEEKGAKRGKKEGSLT